MVENTTLYLVSVLGLSVYLLFLRFKWCFLGGWFAWIGGLFLNSFIGCLGVFFS